MPSLRLFREFFSLRATSYGQILSGSFDGLRTLPNSHTCSARELMLEGSTKRPLRPFSSDNQSRRNIIALAQRFLVTSLALILLVVCLWRFSKIQPLSQWEQRFFNTLSILFTGIASLCLGSLSWHLGSMLRWPLLARTMYQIQDVDLILGMSLPTGSLQLIQRHIREWRISRTTFIVTAYLLTNLVGRLSVAVFGLAYNMTDKTGIEYPILATNWTSAVWTRQIFPNGTAHPEKGSYDGSEVFMNSVRNGVQKYTKGLGTGYSPEAGFMFAGGGNSYLESDLQVSNTTLELGANTAKYSYELKDFKEGYAILSNRTVHSVVNCSIIEVGEDRYWRWNNRNRTGPFDWGKESAEIAPEISQLSNRKYSPSRPSRDNYSMSFLDIANGSHVSPQIYLTCTRVRFAWECWPTLTETVRASGSRPNQPPEGIFHQIDLYQLLTSGLGTSRSRGRLVNLYGTASLTVLAPSIKLEQICLSISPNFAASKDTSLLMAGLVARLPILGIMHANTELPQFAKGINPGQIGGIAYLHRTLDVDWSRVVLIAASIIGGQILAILAVLYYCKGIYTRDDSYLATAELLKTVINRSGDGKLMTGEELATSLDDVLGAPVSYGTRKGQDGGPPEVDLASGLDANFPPFPQK